MAYSIVETSTGKNKVSFAERRYQKIHIFLFDENNDDLYDKHVEFLSSSSNCRLQGFSIVLILETDI